MNIEYNCEYSSTVTNGEQFYLICDVFILNLIFTFPIFTQVCLCESLLEKLSLQTYLKT